MSRSVEDITDTCFLIFMGACAIITIVVLGAVGLRMVRASLTPFDECNQRDVVVTQQMHESKK